MKLNTKLAIAIPLVLALLGIAYAQTRPSTPPPIQSSLPVSAARYQIVMNPGLARDTFLLDTQTGRVWQRAAYRFLEGDPDAWMIQPKFDNEKEETAWVAQQPRKKQP